MKYLKIIWQPKIKIIITDDHALLRKGVRTVLEKWNDLEIIGEAANGKELLDLLDTVIPDIVILNVNMPVMNGIETLPRIRSKYPDLKVIILSMHDDLRMITHMMSLGANTYLTKNHDGPMIAKAIRSVHEYGSFYSEAIQRVMGDFYLKTQTQKQLFSDKEWQILALLMENKTVKQMAGILDVSEGTMSAILDKLKRKLNP